MAKQWIAYAFTIDRGNTRRHETRPCSTKKGARNQSIALIMRLAESQRVITYGVLEHDPIKPTLSNSVLGDR